MNFMKWVITVSVCLVILAGLAAFKALDIRQSIAEAGAYPEQSETVEEAFIATTQFAPTTAVIGEIVAPRRLDMRNELAGEISAVNFASGDYVEAGQLLIQLDTSVEEASLEAARARAVLARQVFDRTQNLFETDISTRDDLDRARAELAATEAEIKVLGRTIDKKTLTAPFAGRTGLHTFEVGQYLMSNTLITSLVGDTGYMWVDFQVPQFYPSLSLQSQVSLDTISNARAATSASATIVAENTVLNENNRSHSYRASLPTTAGQFTANTMVEVSVPIAPPETMLQVPAVSIQNDPLGQFIFVLQEDEAGLGYRAHRQQVRVSMIENDVALLEPSPALREGMRIAGAGAFKLYEGILVHTSGRQTRLSSDGPAENPALIGEQP